PKAGAVTFTVWATLAPFAIEGAVGHVTTPPDSVPPRSAERSVGQAGRRSRTPTSAARLGPASVTAMRKQMRRRAATPAGPDLATARFAISFTEVETRFAAAEPLLFVESGSPVAASARATFNSVPEAGAVTVTVWERFAPFARLAVVGHVTTPPDSVPP